MWKRDTKKYRTNVMNKFKQIRLEKEQKIILKRMLENDLMPNFAIGILCLLKYGSNWFRKENGRKKRHFWNGIFSCISCENSFKLNISSFEMDELIINLEKYKINHKSYVVRSDADVAKSSFDLLVKSSCKKGIKGFIQEISISPFSMKIYSEIQ
ncbi:hypothetical protein BpHYR1_043116 [Brachionus plicatilis]|uniref:Uncharacterized protein n=1 Tax=Brachionus plicatilis TaxID=10195 RepID=A0A3M7QGX6_BRAPC|nr:hypothetical protein BpHYR1_043116 [Brachionus plicatilis]